MAQVAVIYPNRVIILCLILLFGQIIYILEPKQFTSVFEGIWWAVVTVSTVGYGDYVPHTPLDRQPEYC